MKRNYIVLLWVMSCSFSASAAAVTVKTEVISRPYTNAPVFLGDSLGVELSGDGRWAIITSSAQAIPRENVSKPSLDVFLVNVANGDSRLISRSGTGAPGDGPSVGLGISANGRYVLLESEADDLINDDTNHLSDVFLYDTAADVMTMVSRSGDALGNGVSTGATMTPDGRFVVFESAATNLGGADTNEVPDLFWYDRQTATLKGVTEGFLGGEQRPGFEAGVSADGRFVTFLSSATNAAASLAPGAPPQAYVRNMDSGELYWVTRQAGGGPAPYVSNPRLSTNGSVAFVSSDLLTGPAELVPSTYVHLAQWEQKSTQKLPDPDGLGTEPRTVTELVMTPDARYVAYILTYGFPWDGFPTGTGVYVFDVAANTNRVVSTIAYGGFADGRLSDLAISDDGQIITFLRTDTNRTAQLFRYDQRNGKTVLLSRNVSSEAADEDVTGPVLSADGSTAAFTSSARNLAGGESGPGYRAFAVPTRGDQAATLLQAERAGAASSTASGSSRFPISRNEPRVGVKLTTMSGEGARVVFTSSAWNLLPNDRNERVDILTHDRLSGLMTRIDVPDNTHLEVKGVSSDASIIAFAVETPIRNDGLWNLQVYDSKLGRYLFDGLASHDSNRFVYAASLSANGRFLSYGVAPEPGFGANYWIRDLWTDVNTSVPITPGQAINAVAFSSGAKYAVLWSPIASALRPSQLVDWRSGDVFPFVGLYVGSTADDASVLFTTANALPSPGNLFLHGSGGNSSNLVATNVSFPAISLDGSVIVCLERSPVKAAIALDQRTGARIPFPARPDGKPSYLAEIPSVSPDGRFVAFTMKRDNGREDDDFLDVYLYDRVLTNLTRVSQTPNGGFPNLPSRNPTVSWDGRTVVFESLASDLVPDDRNLDFDVFVATLAQTDSDQDGLEDGWELQHFGSLAFGSQTDTDGDRVSNGDEWRAGTDPRNAASSLRLEVASTPVGTYVLSWSGSIGRQYEIEFRDAFGSGTWTRVGHSVTAPSEQISIELPPAAPGGFYRVKVAE